MTRIFLAISIPLLCLLFSCDKEDDSVSNSNCPETDLILEQFVQPSGEEIIISSDGLAYQVQNGSCTVVATYFSTDFREASYLENASGTFLIADSDLIEVKNEWAEDFKDYDNFNSLFLLSLDDKSRFWNTMTLQSPAAKTVAEYIQLRECIFEGTCDFIDNKIELADDPTGLENQCLKFTAVGPSPDMVTSKSSIQSLQQFFELGDELWFQADFYIENELPFSLVDFENRYFEGSPGPRIVISNDRLAVENKFGAKDFFRHQKNITVPLDKWFTVKLHFVFNNTADGLIELWQDGELLFSLNGKNLPTSNSLQNSLEIGITATSEACGLYLDNMRLSEEAF